MPGPPPAAGADATGTVSTMHGGLQLGPPGRWWDDRAFAQSLGLNTGQQQHMDKVFDANRATILGRYQTYQQAQSQLEALTRASPLDEGALMAEIEKVGRARISLEQANTHMLIGVRALMTAEQINRLDSHR